METFQRSTKVLKGERYKVVFDKFRQPKDDNDHDIRTILGPVEAVRIKGPVRVDHVKVNTADFLNEGEARRVEPANWKDVAILVEPELEDGALVVRLPIARTRPLTRTEQDNVIPVGWIAGWSTVVVEVVATEDGDVDLELVVAPDNVGAIPMGRLQVKIDTQAHTRLRIEDVSFALERLQHMLVAQRPNRGGGRIVASIEGSREPVEIGSWSIEPIASA